MTEKDTNNGDGQRERPGWLKDIDEAFTRTGNAIRTAWDATGDQRASTLESARKATRELGDIIEEGIAAAKQRWAEEKNTTAEPEEE